MISDAMTKPSRSTIFILACVLAAAGTSAYWLYALNNRVQRNIEAAPTPAATELPTVTDVAAAEITTVLPAETPPAAEAAPVEPPADEVMAPAAPVPAKPLPPAPAPEPAPVPAKPGPFTLFVGDGCPHCAKVEQYLVDNGVRDRVDLTLKEVYHDRANLDALTAQAQACNIPTDKLAVPFLWTGRECLMGDVPVIDFFNSIAGQ